MELLKTTHFPCRFWWFRNHHIILFCFYVWILGHSHSTFIPKFSKLQTGVAGILVDQNSGKNAINVIVGAPSSLKVSEIEKQINLIKSSKIFLTQLEIPKDVILHCLKIAKENGCITILNPAPASEISKEFYNHIDFFTPNETEAEFYTGIKITNDQEAKQAADKLINELIFPSLYSNCVNPPIHLT